MASKELAKATAIQNSRQDTGERQTLQSQSKSNCVHVQQLPPFRSHCFTFYIGEVFASFRVSLCRSGIVTHHFVLPKCVCVRDSHLERPIGKFTADIILPSADLPVVMSLRDSSEENTKYCV
ncbi:hypothetical protein OUZ56_000206 [Daphnia magna]|uniref:Uncharacterized protein n=1 Tax=Daphnia magna TaxID=35525 RepID=A0ABQ9ZYZ7_9CRUS|nr:hypothetical protein OUZ56_000206 [Daphnia magna]